VPIVKAAVNTLAGGVENPILSWYEQALFRDDV